MSLQDWALCKNWVARIWVKVFLREVFGACQCRVKKEKGKRKKMLKVVTMSNQLLLILFYVAISWPTAVNSLLIFFWTWPLFTRQEKMLSIKSIFIFIFYI
jgi:hypothetical protein